MSNTPTPETDAAELIYDGNLSSGYADVDVCRKLERELAEARAEVARLREALDFTLSCLKHHHMTKPGIVALVKKAEAIAAKEAAK